MRQNPHPESADVERVSILLYLRRSLLSSSAGEILGIVMMMLEHSWQSIFGFQSQSLKGEGSDILERSVTLLIWLESVR